MSAYDERKEERLTPTGTPTKAKSTNLCSQRCSIAQSRHCNQNYVQKNKRLSGGLVVSEIRQMTYRQCSRKTEHVVRSGATIQPRINYHSHSRMCQAMCYLSRYRSDVIIEQAPPNFNLFFSQKEVRKRCAILINGSGIDGRIVVRLQTPQWIQQGLFTKIQKNNVGSFYRIDGEISGTVLTAVEIARLIKVLSKCKVSYILLSTIKKTLSF